MNRLGIFFKLCATLFFTGMGACIRGLGDSIPAGQTMFFRSFLALIPLLIMLAYRNEVILAIRVNNLWDHIRRSATGAIGVFLMIMALTYIPLADVTAIGFLTPLFTIVLAAIFVGDHFKLNRTASVITGFLGVIIMLWPNFGFNHQEISPDFVFGLLCALGWSAITACVVILVRKITQTETTWSIVFYFCITCSVLSLLSLPLGWIWPSTWQMTLLMGAGLCGGVAQLLMTQSYRLAPPSVVAPFDYAAMIWAIIMGWIFFGEVPGIYALCGSALVIIAGLYVIYSENNKTKIPEDPIL